MDGKVSYVVRRGVILTIAAVAPLSCVSAEEIYRSDFSQQIRPKYWMSTATHIDRETGKRWLGLFRRQSYTILKLDDLPEHKFVRLKFDLLLTGTPEGCPSLHETDGWSVSVVGGPLLLVTSFQSGDEGVPQQNFPDEWPNARHPSGTGCLDGDPTRYRFDLTMPHSGSEIRFQFRGAFRNAPESDDGWALGNVHVETVAEAPEIDAGEIARRWESLAGADAIKANEAVWNFIAMGEDGLREVDRRWREATAAAEAKRKEKSERLRNEFERHLTDLKADDFKTRQAATSAILKLGADALPLIDRQLAQLDLDDGIRALLLRMRRQQADKTADREKGVSYDEIVASRVARVRRVVGLAKPKYRATASKDLSGNWSDQMAVIDGYAPGRSRANASPRYTWYPEVDTEGWVQLNMPEAKEVSRAGVFWFYDKWGTQMPVAWKLLFRDGAGEWQPVSNPSKFGLEEDRFNEVSFDPVTTDAVRFVATISDEKSAGIHEVFVD